jgi:D-sedoheptulose 7-phosphate isomerase
MNTQRILAHFQESADLKMRSAATLAPHISQAVELMFGALSNGNKILACGNGGSAADCQHFAAELVGRFERERFPLPAIALTTDTSILTAVGNDYSFREIYSKQVRIVAFTGKDGGQLAKLLTDADVHVNVPHSRTARIQEVHLCAIHCICDGIDVALFGGDENA